MGFDVAIVDEWDGMMVLYVAGAAAWDLFRHEPGGHRWQRIPPNERKGKVHSSTVTVAVFPDRPKAAFAVRESDCEVTTCRGSGPGGQNRNNTNSAVQVKHLPSGLAVRCETERSQSQNKASAMSLLAARLESRHSSAETARVVDNRRSQIGSGERSDKIRTVQMQNGQVVNHVTGAKVSVEKYLRGDLQAVTGEPS